MAGIFWFALFIGGGLVLAYQRVSLLTATVSYAVALLLYTWFGSGSLVWLSLLWLVLAGLVVLNLDSLRMRLITRPFLRTYRRMLPSMSQTEKDALEAGTVWWDGELFSGGPDWDKLLSAAPPRLSTEEQAFLDGPCEELCRMVNDWDVTHRHADLPPAVWDYIKAKGFFAMIIPKKYGGLEFSAYAHSCVLVKLSSRSGVLASTVAVPNSLGPAELLLHYGTDEQRDYYLPRLARGEEVPCFALTGPRAGSDAGSIPDTGVVCKGIYEGREIIGVRLNFSKRYITLAPIATVIGLAFRLFDPDRLLGGERSDYGITCALIPRHTAGVTIGRRHFPLNNPFQNGPIQGRDVFVPLDVLIGGVKMAGQGWRMLVEQLSVGRCISLPSSATGAAKAAVFASGAYARIRRQFNTSVGNFEGIAEVLARMTGHAYIMDAARSVTAGAIDGGEKPSVPAAMLKHHLTELARTVANDAMDVHGGKGICMGPNNYLASAYMQTPIAITVEGANILTRTMIIFGQGVIRGHPFVLKEIEATREKDQRKALRDFDRAFFGHIAFTLSNVARVLWMGFTGARLTRVPGAPELRHYYQQLTRLSSAFALTADMAMFLCGGSLKRRERLSARLGDVLSQLYLASTVLKRYEDDGRPQADLPLVRWGLLDCLYRIEEAFYSIFENLPWPVVSWVLRGLIFPVLMPYGREFAPPRDPLGHDVVGLMMTPGPTRDRLTRGVFISANEQDPVRTLESALVATIAAEAVEAKLREAQQAGRIRRGHADQVAAAGLKADVITQAEADLLKSAAELRRHVIMVDDFPKDFGKSELHQTTQPVTFEALARKNPA